jgi:hypothetical protein
MPALTGSFVSGAVQIASTWGTAAAAGAGDKFAAEYSISPAVDVLTARGIGSGAYMDSNFTRGNILYTGSFTADLGFRNNCDVLLAQMMGTAAAPTETTGGQSDFLHTITFNTTLNAKYVTIAYESSSTTVHELPTAAVTGVTIASTAVPGYVDFTANVVANTLQLSTAVNTNAVLQAATFTEGTPELVTANLDDTFRTNAQSGGALAGGDQYNVTGFELSLERPQEIVNEIAGTASTTAPVASDKFQGSFTVQVKDLADHAMYTIWAAETARKARLSFEGTQIGTGVNKRFTVLLPRMLLVDAPAFTVTAEGRNPLSLTFRLAKAAANPTGMSSTFPYFEIVNGLSTSLLA